MAIPTNFLKAFSFFHFQRNAQLLDTLNDPIHQRSLSLSLSFSLSLSLSLFHPILFSIILLLFLSHKRSYGHPSLSLSLTHTHTALSYSHTLSLFLSHDVHSQMDKQKVTQILTRGKNSKLTLYNSKWNL